MASAVCEIDNGSNGGGSLERRVNLSDRRIRVLSRDFAAISRAETDVFFEAYSLVSQA
jgi:hypothetical protein